MWLILMPGCGGEPFTVAPPPPEPAPAETDEAALARAREVAGPEGEVLVAGSIFLLGEILSALSPPESR